MTTPLAYDDELDEPGRCDPAAVEEFCDHNHAGPVDTYAVRILGLTIRICADCVRFLDKRGVGIGRAARTSRIHEAGLAVCTGCHAHEDVEPLATFYAANPARLVRFCDACAEALELDRELAPAGLELLDLDL